MQGPTKRRFSFLHAAVVWMLLIFVTSCFLIPLESFILFVQRLIPVPAFQGWFDRFWRAGWFLVVKGWHATEYAVLTVLVAAMLHRYRGMEHATSIRLAFVFAVLFAASDEWHQTFVPGRDGCLRDVIIDAVGALVAVLLLAFRKPSPAKGQPDRPLIMRGLSKK